MTKINDAELVGLTLTGDKNAYCQLVIKHQTALRNYIAVHAYHSNDVDDLAQEAFLLAYNKLSGLEQHGTFRSWLFGIGLNLARNHRRKFNPTKSGNDLVLDTMMTEQLENNFIPDHYDFSMSALGRCIKKLNQENQLLINLYYEQNFSIKMLLKKFNLKHSSLTMRLHRVRKLLQLCVNDCIEKDRHE